MVISHSVILPPALSVLCLQKYGSTKLLDLGKICHFEDSELFLAFCGNFYAFGQILIAISGPNIDELINHLTTLIAQFYLKLSLHLLRRLFSISIIL